MNTKDVLKCVLEEQCCEQYAKHYMREIWDWIDGLNENAVVQLNKISLEECYPWYYDKQSGEIRNIDRSFFQIIGVQHYENDALVSEQPIILQKEIGFLGIICCKIQGVWHYLMQGKIEPGNVNVVQISPTVQATKSNFEQKHGGKVPDYLDFFLEMKPESILVDQIQSEQSSRFWGKRNRNVILMVDREFEEKEHFRWMTLIQIKELMKHNNIVNMDTRTVISCIPYVLLGQEGDVPFKNKPYFYQTAWNLNRKAIVEIYKCINDYKMFKNTRKILTPLHELKSWDFLSNRIVSKGNNPFEVIFCDIQIEGREVKTWKQPLFAAKGSALFGLFCCDNEGVLQFLVKPRAEIGCLDMMEIGPSIQIESTEQACDEVERLFIKKLNSQEYVVADILLSEEGGRFYQEENRNAIIMINKSEIKENMTGYIWSDFGTLNMLTQVNNCLNIQLRNLLSLLEI